jgi:hypothetical protein
MLKKWKVKYFCVKYAIFAFPFWFNYKIYSLELEVKIFTIQSLYLK